MNKPHYDGIVIGAGHNGLIAAAYLAKAGLKLAVFEPRPFAGGGFTTEELTVPGFKHNIHATYLKIHDSPVHGDLDLGRYGVSYLFPHYKNAFVRHDSYFLYSHDMEENCESIKRHSAKDAQTFRKVIAQWRQWYLDFMLPEVYSAPRPPAEWEAWVRGKPGGNEYADVVLNYSPVEYAASLYESEYAQYTVIRGAASAEYDVTRKGIPALVFVTMANWWAGRTAIVKGGTRGVPDALVRVIQENGGSVFTGQSVAQILVEAGAARGVVLKDGREVIADRFVASSLDPVNTFLFLVGEDKLPEDVKERLAAYKFNETSLFRVYLALKEAPVFEISKRNPAINDALMYAIGFESPGDFAKLSGQARAGRIPDNIGVIYGNESIHDPTQAPPGMHTAYLGINAPFDLADGGAARWVDVSRDLADRMIGKLREYAPNMTPDKILGKFIYTPKDIEEYLPDMVSGDICQGKVCPEQLGYNRPWPGMSQYRTFIDKLFLCGSAAHPGGHAIGGSGYNAANAIAESLGVAKWWPAYEPRKIVTF